MATAKEKVEYTKSAAQLDLERRMENDNESPLAVSNLAVSRAGVFGEDEDAYVNVDPVYQNHANDTEKPLKADSGVNKKAEAAYRETVLSSEDSDRSKDAFNASRAYVETGDKNPFVSGEKK